MPTYGAVSGTETGKKITLRNSRPLWASFLCQMLISETNCITLTLTLTRLLWLPGPEAEPRVSLIRSANIRRREKWRRREGASISKLVPAAAQESSLDDVLHWGTSGLGSVHEDWRKGRRAVGSQACQSLVGEDCQPLGAERPHLALTIPAPASVRPRRRTCALLPA